MASETMTKEKVLEWSKKFGWSKEDTDKYLKNIGAIETQSSPAVPPKSLSERRGAQSAQDWEIVQAMIKKTPQKEIMKTFNLSESQLNSILRKKEVREALGYNVWAPKLSDIGKDLKAGMSQTDLKAKYSLTDEQLNSYLKGHEAKEIVGWKAPEPPAKPSVEAKVAKKMRETRPTITEDEWEVIRLIELRPKATDKELATSIKMKPANFDRIKNKWVQGKALGMTIPPKTVTPELPPPLDTIDEEYLDNMNRNGLFSYASNVGLHPSKNIKIAGLRELIMKGAAEARGETYAPVPPPPEPEPAVAPTGTNADVMRDIKAGINEIDIKKKYGLKDADFNFLLRAAYGQAPTTPAAPKPSKEKTKMAPPPPTTPGMPRPPPPSEEVYTIASGMEKDSFDRLTQIMGQDYIMKNLPSRTVIVRAGDMAPFCMPAMVKREIVFNLESKISKNLGKLQRIENAPGKAREVTETRAELAMDLYALAENMKRIPTCQLSETEQVIRSVQETYPRKGQSWEDFLQTIATALKVDREKRQPTETPEVKAQIQKKAVETLKQQGISPQSATPVQKVAAEAVAKDEIQRELKATKPKSEKNFITSHHKRVYQDLWSYLYNGATGDHPAMSPCGLKLNLEGEGAIIKSEDLLAFYGSGDDWTEFYINGKTEVEMQKGSKSMNQPMTFHRMHENDWPGCFVDMFQNQNLVSQQALEKKIAEVNKKHNLKLTVSDFVVDNITRNTYVTD